MSERFEDGKYFHYSFPENGFVEKYLTVAWERYLRWKYRQLRYCTVVRSNLTKSTRDPALSKQTNSIFWRLFY